MIIILVSSLFSTLLSPINCHCNQVLQHQPFVVIHLRPELPEYYFGSYSKQLGDIEVAEECHIEVVVEEVTKCDTSHHIGIQRQCQCMMWDLQLIQ